MLKLSKKKGSKFKLYPPSYKYILIAFIYEENHYSNLYFYYCNYQIIIKNEKINWFPDGIVLENNFKNLLLKKRKIIDFLKYFLYSS